MFSCVFPGVIKPGSMDYGHCSLNTTFGTLIGGDPWLNTSYMWNPTLPMVHTRGSVVRPRWGGFYHTVDDIDRNRLKRHAEFCRFLSLSTLHLGRHAFSSIYHGLYIYLVGPSVKLQSPYWASLFLSLLKKSKQVFLPNPQVWSKSLDRHFSSKI